jgi:hypothetical protein
MLVFNNTDVPVDFRDRVIMPGRSIDYPSVTDQTLTPDERKVLRANALGAPAVKAMSIKTKLKLSPTDRAPVISVARLSTLL